MRIRPYKNQDYDTIAQWITDERIHALWCGNITPYPLEKKAFEEMLQIVEAKYGDHPFVAETEDGQMAGFFCFSQKENTNEGMFKFVVIDNTVRNRGYGCEMIRLAAKNAFETRQLDRVCLNVYSANPGAKKCYERAGFKEESYKENGIMFHTENWGMYHMILNRC